MILFLKKNIYAFKFIKLCFTSYKLHKFNNIFFVFKIYLIKVFFSYKLVRKIFLKTKSVDYVEERLFNEKTDAISITNQLIKDGISKSLNYKEAFIEEIIKEISDKKNLKYNNINFLNLNELMNFAEKENISRLVIPLDLNQNLKINNLINSNFFKTVVENYLNKKEVSINCSLFISLAKKNITEREKISN